MKIALLMRACWAKATVPRSIIQAQSPTRAHDCVRWKKNRFTLENGNLEELEPLSADVLRRIVEGGWKSKELRGEWKAMLPPI